MKKKLGFWSIVLLTINSIIGSGIFLSPGSVVAMSGTLTPLIYCMAAIFAIILAITFSSAAKYVSKSGAAYAYAKAAFGANVGFYVGITRFIAASIAWGVMATGVVKTIISIFGGDNSNLGLVTVGFVALMVLLLLINIFGPGLLKIINNLSTIGKLLALITTIIVGVIIVLSTGVNHFGEINSYKNAFGKPIVPAMTTSNFVMATIAAFYAFTGFESAASGSEDMENPEKNLPKAIPLAIFTVAVIYIGIVIVSMMINPQAIIKTKEVVALVSVFDHPIIKNIILYGALISMFGINVAASFHTPRVLEAMSREKQIPSWFEKRQNDFPLRAFLVTVIIAIVIPIVFKYNMTSIIILSSISRFIQFLVVPVGVISFYYGKSVESTLKNAKKNFALDVIAPVLSLILSIFLLIKFDWLGQFSIIDKAGISHVNFYAILAMIVGYIVLPIILFLLAKKQKNNKRRIK